MVVYLTLHVPQQQGQGVRTRVSGQICPNLDTSCVLDYVKLGSKLLYEFCGVTSGFAPGTELRMVTHL